MSVDTTIAVLYAQTGLGTQFAHAAAVTPHAQAAMTRVLALETAKQEQQAVEKTSKGENKGINKDKDSRQKQDISFGSRRRQRIENDENSDLSLFKSDPLSGNLLNLTV